MYSIFAALKEKEKGWGRRRKDHAPAGQSSLPDSSSFGATLIPSMNATAREMMMRPELRAVTSTVGSETGADAVEPVLKSVHTPGVEVGVAGRHWTP